jgi:hypothetical protein
MTLHYTFIVTGIITGNFVITNGTGVREEESKTE